MSRRDKAVGFLIIVVFIILVLWGATIIADTGLDNSAIPFVIVEDTFVDIDGDGDLDYVHYAEYVEQWSPAVEAANPYPAPNQPGQ